MNNTVNNRKLELHSRIEELEESLARLKSELKKEEENELHCAIDNLEIYLDAIDNKYENVRTFWPIVAEELRALINGFTNDGIKKRG